MTSAEFNTTNPATGRIISAHTAMAEHEISDIVSTARRAYPEWKKDYERRRNYVYNLVEYLKKHKESLASVITTEMGKTIKESTGEIEKCAWALEFYADPRGELSFR